MQESSFLHNMSAPPRSNVVIAPHRQHRNRARISIPGMPSVHGDWKAHVLRYCREEDWDVMIQKTAGVLVNVPRAMVLVASVADISHVVVPLQTVAILSRTVGTLFQKDIQPVFTYERLSQQCSTVDIQNLRTRSTSEG